jgi:hypothetical protein
MHIQTIGNSAHLPVAMRTPAAKAQFAWRRVKLYRRLAFSLLIIVLVFVQLLRVAKGSSNQSVITKYNNTNYERFGQQALNKSSCTWSLDLLNEECRELLVSKLCARNNDSRQTLGRRFLVLGDSTMGPNFMSMYLQELRNEQPVHSLYAHCPGLYSCGLKNGGQCWSNEMFDLSYPVNGTWIPPDHSKGEGPIHFGLGNPFCSDCVSTIKCDVMQNCQ